MSTTLPSQGIALFLAAIPPLGLFGADKFYLGLTTQGIIMVLLTLTLVGCLITVPWTYLCILFLIISILWGKTPLIYPNTINWAPLQSMDKIVAWVVIGLWLLGIVVGIIYKRRSSNNSSSNNSSNNNSPTKTVADTDIMGNSIRYLTGLENDVSNISKNVSQAMNIARGWDVSGITNSPTTNPSESQSPLVTPEPFLIKWWQTFMGTIPEYMRFIISSCMYSDDYRTQDNAMDCVIARLVSEQLELPPSTTLNWENCKVLYTEKTKYLKLWEIIGTNRLLYLILLVNHREGSVERITENSKTSIVYSVNQDNEKQKIFVWNESDKTIEMFGRLWEEVSFIPKRFKEMTLPPGLAYITSPPRSFGGDVVNVPKEYIEFVKNVDIKGPIKPDVFGQLLFLIYLYPRFRTPLINDCQACVVPTQAPPDEHDSS